MRWISLDASRDALEIAERCQSEARFHAWWKLAAPQGIVLKERFLPEDLGWVLGRVAVLRPEADGGVLVRLWGERLRVMAGADLTGANLMAHGAFGALAEAVKSVSAAPRMAFAETMPADEREVMICWIVVGIEDGRALALGNPIGGSVSDSLSIRLFG